MKNKFEGLKTPENDIGLIIENALRHQLEKMQEGERQGRKDRKFLALRDFVNLLKGETFEKAFAGLSEVDKHAIITRLENEVIDGSVPYNFVRKLEEDLYGVINDGEGDTIDFATKVKLEKELQNENIEPR